MTDVEVLESIQSYLASPGEAADAPAALVWQAFYDRHDPMIRSILRARRAAPGNLDDLAQDVWCVLIQIMAMHWIREQPATEIAAELGLTRHQVKGIIRRSTNKLSGALRCGGFSPRSRII